MIPFPNLPPSPQGQPWPANVITAFGLLHSTFEHAERLIAQQDSDDPIRLRAAASNLDSQAGLLDALGRAGLSEDWVHEAALAMVTARESLNQMAQGQSGIDSAHANIQFYGTTHIRHTGKRGRPRKIVDLEYLTEAFSDHRNISITRLADALNINRKTLTAYIKAYGLSRAFSSISDQDLDTLIREYRQLRPASGIRYVMGFLRRKGIRVQRRRAINALHRVDQIGVILRRQSRIRRHQYSVRRPGALWHCDGHHKLIRWGIVIHGFIDGYSRLITALRAGTSNSARRVLQVFKTATKKYGAPSRIRGDRGGENVKVSTWMIAHRGLNRASFMWGSSTHNTRIERLWVEVGTQFCRQWRAFFLRLERLYDLNPKQPVHLWLLHFLFLNSINHDAERFRQDWNLHPLSTPGLHNQSPHDLHFLGQTTEGMYPNVGDPMDDINPELIHRYYGVYGRRQNRGPHQTGAGHGHDEGSEPDFSDTEMETSHISVSDGGSSSGESENEFTPLEQLIANDIRRNIRHPPVRVPPNSSPFTSDHDLDIFALSLKMMKDAGTVPSNSGLDGDEEWNPVEEIPLGQRKHLTMSLPEEVWRDRALQWVQAVHLLSHMQLQMDLEH